MTGSKPMTYTRYGFQGDVAFRRVDAIPEGYAPAQPKGIVNGKPGHVAADSETGHHHIIAADSGTLYEGTDAGIAYLRLAEDSADVVHLRAHDTHGTITLLGGAGAVWQVVRQREFDGAAERRAQD